MLAHAIFSLHTMVYVCVCVISFSVHLILMDLYFIGIQQENSIEQNVLFSLLFNNNRKHKHTWDVYVAVSNGIA